MQRSSVFVLDLHGDLVLQPLVVLGRLARTLSTEIERATGSSELDARLEHCPKRAE